MRFDIGGLLLALALVLVLPARGALPPAVRDALGAAGIPEEAMGAIVMRATDGAVMLAHRPEAAMQPASTLKLLTSIAALETLGPQHRTRTRLLAAGEVVGGVLRGDLVLQGGGDPDLDWQAFERMLRSLRMQGVKEIGGDLVLDLSAFRPARFDVGLAPFDEAPEFRYNVIPDALFLNGYLVDLALVSRGNAVAVQASPPLAGVTFAPQFALVDRACDDWEDGWKLPTVTSGTRGGITVRLHGEFPRDCEASTAIAVLDRVVYADRLFRALWSRLGGKFRGRTREGAAPPAARLAAEHVSRPLSEVVRDINKRSDNPVTRLVYLALGETAGEPGATTFERAERAVRSWLASRGIDASGLTLDNGSGLSRVERIRPEQLAAVLRAAARSRWAPEFLASLPIVAVDGAMRKRLAESPAAGRARIKTGTLRDVSAVAGYVDDASGTTHVVVAMINHEAANRRVARPILDTLLDWVARQGSGRAASEQAPHPPGSLIGIRR